MYAKLRRLGLIGACLVIAAAAVGALLRPSQVEWPLPTYDPDIWGTAGATLQGVVQFDPRDHCVSLQQDTGLNVALIWPPGHTIVFDPHAVLDPNGQQVLDGSNPTTFTGRVLPPTFDGRIDMRPLDDIGMDHCVTTADMAFLVETVTPS